MDGAQLEVGATDVKALGSAGPPVPGAVHDASRPEPGPTSGRRAAGWWALRVSLLPWVTARALVALALGVAHQRASSGHLSAAAVARVHQGLLGWDAGWYEAIAGHGYAGAGHDSLRFFPLYPLLARGLSVLPGVSVGSALVIVANVCALAGTAVVVALARHESGDEAAGRRAAWLLCLAPPAFAFVMGYAEGTLLVLAAGAFYALRARRWWWAAGLGMAAGLTRPLGAVLVVPGLIEVVRGWRAAPSTDRRARVAAVGGPVLGTGAFLGWVGWRYGDALTPLRQQAEGTHHGLADPLVTLGHDASYLVHAQHLGEGLHLPWVVLTVALVVVAFRHWPASYGAFAGAVLAVALTGSNLDSFERYALSAFPLVLAGVSLTAGRRVLPAVLVASAAGLVAYAVLAFTNVYVP
jgi:hypothetical protein